LLSTCIPSGDIISLINANPGKREQKPAVAYLKLRARRRNPVAFLAPQPALIIKIILNKGFVVDIFRASDSCF
jgi:hypothetical protein